MKNLLEKFLQSHFSFKRPLILGFSGGPDSTALLHLLLEIRKESDFPLHLAHIDHGWRKKSTEEAFFLSKKAEKLKLPFHLKVLQQSPEKNWEEEGRKNRLAFFEELSEKLDAEAVLLAHHADDLAETVLKRIFEGAQLSHLGGMQSISHFKSLMIWRPLLQCSKREISEWIEKKGIQVFDDPTNRDPAFLRAKMRTQIIPLLSNAFGKEITNNLQVLSERSWEYREYLDWKCETILQTYSEGPFGSYIDLSENQAFDLLEMRHVIHLVARKMGATLSRHVVETILEWVFSKRANKKISCGKLTMIVDRGRVFFTKKELPLFSGSQKLHLGKQKIGPWQVNCEKLQEGFYCQDWQELWKGSCRIVIPDDCYELGLPDFGALLGSTRLKKWWADRKIPAFLRYGIPVITKKNKIFGEFLSGKMKETRGPLLQVHLTIG